MDSVVLIFLFGIIFSAKSVEVGASVGTDVASVVGRWQVTSQLDSLRLDAQHFENLSTYRFTDLKLLDLRLNVKQRDLECLPVLLCLVRECENYGR